MKRRFKLKHYSILMLLLLFSMATIAQQAVTGTVRSSRDNLPVIGATVALQGSNTITVTDDNGNFRLLVPSLTGVINFTHSGMIPVSEKIDGRSVFNLVMNADEEQLSEVVVTAIGIEKNKKALGYSTQVVKGSELTEAREVNIANALKGKVAGVFVNASATGPGGSSYINIRGASSFQGNNQPLYVIDGVPMDNDNVGAPDLSNPVGQARDYGDGIGSVSPDDIESITVLKGPNGASLYGARGANGVILITTKKGSAAQKPKIELNSNATYESALVTPKRQNVYGPGWVESLDVNGWTKKTAPDGREYYEMGTAFDAMWGPKMEGQLISIQLWPMLGIFEMTPKGEDEAAKFYNVGSTFTNSAGISGGNDKIRFRASYSDLRNTGIFPNSEYDRQTISTAAEYKATSKLTVESRVTYTKTAGKNRPGYGTNLNTIAMSLQRYPAFLSDEMLQQYKNPAGQAENWADGRPFNPYWIANEFLSEDSRDRINGYLTARYKFTNWLSLQARGGTDFYTELRDSRIGINTPTGGEGDLRRGQVNDDRLRMIEENFDVLLSANGKLSHKFTGSFSAGASRRNRTLNTTTLKGNKLTYDHVYNISNATVIVATDYANSRRMNSAYFTGQLDYNSYLFLDISGRQDWSSTLGVGNQAFFYPSASASFVFTDAFHLPKNVLSFGKVRLSVAQAGKDGSPFSTQVSYVSQPVLYNGQRRVNMPGTIPAPDLKNELTTSVEAGTELRFWQDRLSIDFTYYNALAKNQILDIEIPASVGFGKKRINAGAIRNEGIEFMITGKPVKTRNFGWVISLNASHNRSKVEELYPNIPAISLFSTGETSIDARVGLPFGNITTYRFKRNENGDIVVSDKGTWLREDNMSVVGNIQPDYLAGISNDFYYKGLSFGALVDIRQGGKIFSMSKYMQYLNGTAIQTAKGDNLVAEGVILQPDGSYKPNITVITRRQYYADLNSQKIGEVFIMDASYIALREIRLGYNIGEFFKKSSPLHSLKLTAVARNVLYIKQNAEMKLMGINPEGAYGPYTTAQGYEITGIPITRTVGFNLSVSL